MIAFLVAFGPKSDCTVSGGLFLVNAREVNLSILQGIVKQPMRGSNIMSVYYIDSTLWY